VLQFNKTETVKLFLVAVGDQTQRIPKSKRERGSNVFLEISGDNGSTLFGAFLSSEGGGTGDKSSEKSELHGDKGCGKIGSRRF
jgi:hypothetical protein